MAAPVPDPPVGSVFGYLTVQAPSESYGKGLKYKRIKVLCQCGVEKFVDKSNLLRGAATSCGCYNVEKNKKIFTKHGMSKSPVYAIWNMMKQRCQLPSYRLYHDYGGRGITVCQEWQTFEGFYADMGEPPFAGASLERKDNDGPYCKGNCVWSTRTEQNRNKRNTVRYMFQGQQLTLMEVSEITGINANTLASRVYGQKLSIDDAVAMTTEAFSEEPLEFEEVPFKA